MVVAVPWTVRHTAHYHFRKDLVGLLSAARETLDVKLLLAVLQKTVAFEKYLTQRFGVVQGSHDSEVCVRPRG